ncbi:ADP-ribosylglycohydrolase family protein [Cesiribacter andamanensis]|uniref:ADP-ribosyl-[dinitrogen reductase] hydrolase n=1 Tax=Cesiribacter andamanensis AMV16 TaxID=1279009 RepID=M7NAG5_9BACT|nr:ADP-ribosylglycohydrolase family protein [Cesiribacter andamanensis]EMR04191.1 ADP-ribosyl-[dinitrogen reductase] hydrolase [Cesiribacter andamanensis AMV16]
MLGAIAGDIIGSVYEHHPLKTTDFPLLQQASAFTDDTVLTIAVAESLLTGKSYAAALKHWGRRYPTAGYGGNFYQWLMSRCSVPYGSWGNGAAMRVSPIGWAFEGLEQTLEEAARSAAPTHDHPEGILGAQAVAGALWHIRMGKSKETISKWLEETIGYALPPSIERIREGYAFDVSCRGSVPPAIQCFLEAKDTEEAIRLAVSLGGDADTQASIAGALGEARWGIDEKLRQQIMGMLPTQMLEVLQQFQNRYQSG